MNVSELVQKVVGSRKERQKAADESYRDLVRAIGDGQEPNVDEVDEALERVGKTAEELERDVKHTPNAKPCEHKSIRYPTCPPSREISATN